MIRVNDIVFHELSCLFYKCENKKQERWMNMNEYYIKVDNSLIVQQLINEGYFNKVLNP